MPVLLFHCLLVAAGGATGAVLRYLWGRLMLLSFGPALPLGTLGANILGGFAMGMLAGLLWRLPTHQEPLRLLLGVGLLGGFTTFSAFSLEVYEMILRGDAISALAYALLSVTGAVVALWGGILVMRLVA